MVDVWWYVRSSRTGIFTDRHTAFFTTLKPLIALRLAHTLLPVYLVKHFKSLCKIFTKFAAKFHSLSLSIYLSLFLTHSHTHTISSSSAIVTLLQIRRTACALAQFSGCSSTTNAHSETGQMTVCCQHLTLGALSSRNALSVLVGALFKKFGLFLNTPRIKIQSVPRSKHSPSRL